MTDRRSFLKQSSLCAGALLTSPILSWPLRTSAQLRPVDLEFDLTAEPKTLNLFSDKATSVWSYSAALKSGPTNRIHSVGAGFLGPLIEVRKGERLRIRYLNQIPEESIVHWHGLDVPSDQDGLPHHAVPSGGSYQYDFEVLNRAGLYFFHPHPHGRIGYQVTQGLSGIMIVRDEAEDRLGLPSGESEHLICIQDRRVNDQRQFEYLTGGMHDQMMGMHGNMLFINGELSRKRTVSRGVQRLRILNASNARVYNLAWSDGRPLVVIGTDGGLLEKPVELRKLLLAPAERLDILVDFSESNPGDQIQLESQPLIDGRGQTFSIVDFKVSSQEGVQFPIPPQLCTWESIPEKDAVNLGAPKKFTFIATRENGWTIDGLPYDMHEVSAKETVGFGDTEIWEFDNSQSGLMHPLHIHGSPFQVLHRFSGPLKGAMDLGWKDTVLVMPGDKVQIIKRFNSFKGMFVYHCHNLEHEDSSMMRNFLIK